MNHRLLLAAVAVTIFAAPVYAADNTMAPAGAMAAASDMGGSGIKMADHATMALKFTTVTSADMMSSKLVGLGVYNNQNEKLGDVEDLVIKDGKTISGVVVSVGGFLGMGESYVLIDPASIVVNSKDNSMRAFVDTNKDNLKNAPKFTYSKKAS